MANNSVRFQSVLREIKVMIYIIVSLFGFYLLLCSQFEQKIDTRISQVAYPKKSGDVLDRKVLIIETNLENMSGDITEIKSDLKEVLKAMRK